MNKNYCKTMYSWYVCTYIYIKDFKMKKINLIILSSLFALNVSATNYFYTLDDKHYSSSIVIDNSNTEDPIPALVKTGSSGDNIFGRL